VAVLRDQRGGIERRGGAQDRTEVMRIGHLVENDDRAVGVALEHVGQVHLVERQAFEHQPLVRRVARDESGEVGAVGVLERKVGRQFAVERGEALARGPQLAVAARGIVQRRFDRVAAPQPDGALRRAAGAASALHASGASAQVSFVVSLGHAAPCQRPH
jgi:hypothetical protein